jgi:hypothetical protein
MRLLHRNCREVTALVLARQDRELGLGERLLVRIHMLICKGCPRFERQVALVAATPRRLDHEHVARRHLDRADVVQRLARGRRPAPRGSGPARAGLPAGHAEGRHDGGRC